MAHFAEIKQEKDPSGFTDNTHWIVQRVVVVDNDIDTAAGKLGDNDMHADGEVWCQSFFKGGTWKQTSYNHNFRKQYAGIGYVYDSTKDKFLTQQPFASWSLDDNDDWQAPITYPSVVDDGADPVVWRYFHTIRNNTSRLFNYRWWWNRRFSSWNRWWWSRWLQKFCCW